MSYPPPLQNNDSCLCSVLGVSGWIFLAQFRLRGQSKANERAVELRGRVGTAGPLRNQRSFTFSPGTAFGWHFTFSTLVGLVGVFLRLPGS